MNSHFFINSIIAINKNNYQGYSIFADFDLALS